jgi:hypothetical protein
MLTVSDFFMECNITNRFSVLNYSKTNVLPCGAYCRGTVFTVLTSNKFQCINCNIIHPVTPHIAYLDVVSLIPITI